MDNLLRTEMVSSRNKNRWKHAVLCVGLFCLYLIIITMPAYATAQVPDGYTPLPDGYNADFAAAAGVFYSMARKIALPLAALAITIGGIQMMFGNEDAIKRGKTTVVCAILALCALLILPLFLKFGKSLVENYQWNPFGGNDVGIDPAVID